MANWQSRFSSPLAHRTDYHPPALLPLLALLAGGCGHAGDRAASSEAAGALPALAPAPADTSMASAAEALCAPASTGTLRARLQGDIDAEIDWGAQAPHCQASVRPPGDGIRLVFKGTAPGAGPLLLVFGLSPLRPGESARNVPVNLTVVREGSGRFFATRGDDKCALDSVTQAPAPGDAASFRLEGRGYCTQPARAVGSDGSVLVSRFDVVAIVPATTGMPGPDQPSSENPR